MGHFGGARTAVVDRFLDQIQEATLAEVARLTEYCQANWVLGFIGDAARIRDALGDWSP